MLKSIYSYTDEEILSLYSEKKLSKNKVEVYFYKKYLSNFRSISYHYMKKIYCAALYKHDLMSLAYDAIWISIKNYLNSSKNYKYGSFLKRSFRCLILDYLKKYMRKKHQILNNAKYLNENSLDIYTNDFTNKIYNDLLIERIFGDYFNLNDKEKIIIKNKIDSNSDENISKILEIDKKRVNYIYKSAIKKIKTMIN